MAPSVLLLLTIVLVMGATGILGYKAKSPTDSELDKYGSDNEIFADIKVHQNKNLCNALDYRVDRSERLLCPMEWMDTTINSFEAFKNFTHGQRSNTCNPTKVCSRKLVIKEYSHTNASGNKTITYNIRVTKGCINPDTLNNMDYSPEHRCYTTSEDKGEVVPSSLLTFENTIILNSLGISDYSKAKGITLREKSQTCLCYGISFGIDPMSRYLEMLKHQEEN